MFEKNRPNAITTPRFQVLIVLLDILLVAIVSFSAFTLFSQQNDAEASDVEEKVPSVVQVIQEQSTGESEGESLNTPEQACLAISSYYRALNEKDVVALRAMGAQGAAVAVSRGWLDAIGYAMDYAQLSEPNAAEMPASQGLYAGCTYYKISDFYSKAPEKAISSKVYGQRGADGWIYYDPISVRWVISDPCVPTAFSAPQAATVERSSENGEATVTMSCTGVYANSWWAWATAEVEAANRSLDKAIGIETAKHDNGFTVVVPDELKAGAPAAGAEGEEQKVKGTCSMWRGDIQDFGTEKIGARVLEIDGDIDPVYVTFGDENISPVFAVGKSDALDIATQEAETQLAQYGGTNRTDSSSSESASIDDIDLDSYLGEDNNGNSNRTGHRDDDISHGSNSGNGETGTEDNGGNVGAGGSAGGGGAGDSAGNSTRTSQIPRQQEKQDEIEGR